MREMQVSFRFLGPEEGTVLTGAIEAAYGSSYDVRWVYDGAEVAARLGDGRYISCVAEGEDGGLLCHIGMRAPRGAAASARRCRRRGASTSSRGPSAT